MLRKDFLRLLAAAATTAVVAPTVVACSTTNNPDGQPTDTLRIAAFGGPGEGLTPAEAASTATWTVLYAIFESLVIAGDSGPVMQLASDITANDDATAWTVRLRDDAKFSDGSPVTADDVLKSFRSTAQDPMKGMVIADIDVEKSAALDPHTVEFQLKAPRADFIAAVLGISSLVFKGGDAAQGIGSGPYVVESGDSSQGWMLTANEHFPSDRRISNKLEVQSIADAAARLRAVESGAVDLAMDLPATAARSLKTAEAWIPGPADSKALLFVLNTKVPPFDDADVRRAAKLVLDRQALVNQALDGVGEPGADAPGLGFDDYPAELKAPERNLDEARRIFAEKGVTTLTLTTADFSPGMNDGADIAAQQFAEAGVKVTVDKRDPTTYFADMAALTQLPLFASYLVNRPVESALPFLTGSQAMFNLSGFGANPQWDGKLRAAQAETDADKRRDMIQELAREYAETGGDLLWGYANEIHGRTKGLADMPVSQSVPVPTTK
ncbi:ABC transporter substrate-binding protein [Corynebacterium ulceribovis]|uniref:ABC transporter substrate-binding protein n=1 Tax=Corynebacterium ulceribovis TaxID=487732 RepID=UPI0003645DD7|nr:ABC transporter substrate-binding protein [Corynebacterium ulceribovis]